jgi:hypothetical protein
VSGPERRAHRRRDFSGRAFWSAGRQEGSCALYNVSLGGAHIARPSVLLLVGKKLELAIDLGGGPLPSVHATVVRTDEGRVAFRFESPTTAFVEALQRAIRLRERG